MRKIFQILILFACFYSFGQISSDSSVVGIHKRGEGLFEISGSAVGLDNQQITNFSITSNILTLTLEDGGTQTVDLSTYLDNENVASGVISGTDLVLTLTDASTVTIDMSSFSGGSSTALATTYDNTTSGLSATNVKDGLDELATASIPLSSINKNADYTITGTEEDRIVAANPALNDSIVFTINDGVFSGPGFIKFMNKGEGFIGVQQGTIPYMNGDYKTSVGPGSTISLRIEHQDSVYVEPSNLLAYTPLGNGCPTADPFPTNTNPNMIAGNVLAYCPDELNVLPTGGPGDGEINTIGVTESAIADSLTGYGDYVLRVTADDGTGDYLQINHTLVVGEIYEWHLSYKSVQGSSHQYKFQTGNPDTSTIAFTNTTFNTTSGEFTADNTDFAFRVWPALAGSASDAVDIKFYLKLKND